MPHAFGDYGGSGRWLDVLVTSTGWCLWCIGFLLLVLLKLLHHPWVIYLSCWKMVPCWSCWNPQLKIFGFYKSLIKSSCCDVITTDHGWVLQHLLPLIIEWCLNYSSWYSKILVSNAAWFRWRGFFVRIGVCINHRVSGSTIGIGCQKWFCFRVLNFHEWKTDFHVTTHALRGFRMELLECINFHRDLILPISTNWWVSWSTWRPKSRSRSKCWWLRPTSGFAAMITSCISSFLLLELLQLLHHPWVIDLSCWGWNKVPCGISCSTCWCHIMIVSNGAGRCGLFVTGYIGIGSHKLFWGFISLIC